MHQHHFPFKGWTTIAVLMVVLGSAWMYVHREDPSDKPPAYRDDVWTQAMVDFMIEPNLLADSGPVVSRQAYYLKRHIIRCTATQLMLSQDPEEQKYIQHWRSATTLELKDKEHMKKLSERYQSHCATMILDDVLDDSHMAYMMARAMKSVNIAVGPEYENVPNTWPQELTSTHYSQKLAYILGY